MQVAECKIIPIHIIFKNVLGVPGVQTVPKVATAWTQPKLVIVSLGDAYRDVHLGGMMASAAMSVRICIMISVRMRALKCVRYMQMKVIFE